MNECNTSKHVMVMAFCDPAFYKQANLLLLSLLSDKANRAYTVYLYTDSTSWISATIARRIVIYQLTPDNIEHLKGEQNFIHRVKIALIEDLCTKIKGRVLYIDTDCIVKGHLDELFSNIDDNQFVMHQEEFDFKNTYGKSEAGINSLYHRFMEDRRFVAINKKYKLSELNYSMWNAGVIGAKVDQFKAIFNDVYELTHYIFSISESHTSEQLAFSIVLQNHGAITNASDYIYHYWDTDEKLAANDFIEKKIENLNQTFAIKRKLYGDNYFKKISQRISESYLVARNRSITFFENNLFRNGYKLSALAFIKKPLLDWEYRKKITFHGKRHLKHIMKSVIKNYM